MAKKVLILGAGLVARPIVHYLLEKTEHTVICASRTVAKAEELIKGYSRGKAVSLNVSDAQSLEILIKDCDIAISLVPYTHHVAVAELCIKHKKDMVTTSYVSDAMRALDGPARAAGIVVLNEIGLDPGIDHMSAMRIINHVAKNGGTVTSFQSYCGGLPAPEANTNPLGYKFSWSPRGVLMAGRNAAKYLKEGKIVDIPGPELFNNHWPVEVPDYGTLEGYPNRNSLPYIELYGLKETKTMFRGTLRNPGWCKFWYKMAHLGWLNDSPRTDLTGKTWADVLRALVPGKGNLLEDLCKHWNLKPTDDEIKRLEWLGLLGSEKVPADQNNVLDLLCAHLIKKLEFQPHERDMIVLFHDFAAHYPGGKRERITSALIDHGIPDGDSAMSRTVSLPAAIATRLILDGTFATLKGVHIPVMPEVYNPVLDELEAMKIKCVEKFTAVA
jgi:saccharopine dehydrogenase-like NADP-dependent oxidoreductase